MPDGAARCPRCNFALEPFVVECINCGATIRTTHSRGRDNHGLRDLLLELRRIVPIKVVEAWTREEFEEAREWAREKPLGSPALVEPEFLRRWA